MLIQYRFAQEEADVQECLVALIKSTDITNVQSCVNAVRLASSIPCLETFKHLCFTVIPSSVTALRKAAEKVAIEMLDGIVSIQFACTFVMCFQYTKLLIIYN